jgi:Uma2 family endonuclease
MAQPVTHARMTLDEFEALPEQKPYLEYVHGEVIQKPVPKRPHWIIADEMLARLRDYRGTRGGRSGPEPSVYFTTERETLMRVPDVAYWAPGKPEGDDLRSLPPTLAVEIRSWQQSTYDQREKCRFMRRYGVDVCWLIDPDARTVEVYEGEGEPVLLTGDAVLESAHLPGFSLALADLWAVLDD